MQKINRVRKLMFTTKWRQHLIGLCCLSMLWSCASSNEMHIADKPIHAQISPSLLSDVHAPASKNLGVYALYESCTQYASQQTSITQVCANAMYHQNGKLAIDTPSAAKLGDLLLLFLSRTDNPLPHTLVGWTAVASCLKSHNGQNECRQINECEVLNNNYCLDTYSAGNKKGEDLGTVVFYKTLMQNNEQFSFELKGSRPAWAILASISGANTTSPIAAHTTESSDGNRDSLFPSVYANAKDLTLFSMAFDDTANINDFRSPTSTTMHAWIAGEDEAGSLYGKIMQTTGESGKHKTRGVGGWRNKDALISIVVRSR